jgi:hypothetical protein
MGEYELVADEASYRAKQKTIYIQLILDGTAKGWYKAALKRYEGKLKSELGSQSSAADATSEDQKWSTLKDEFISHFTPDSALNDAMLRQRVEEDEEGEENETENKWES